MLYRFVSMSCHAGLVASASVFGLFLNTSGQVQPVEAFNIKIQQTTPIRHWYFKGHTQPSGHGRPTPFVARLTYDIRAKNVKQGRTRAYGEYAIKEFVFTTKYQYSRVPSGSIKIYNNSLNFKDAIEVAVGGFYMTLFCRGNYITSLSLPRHMKDRACWANSINFKRFTGTNLRSVTGSKTALLRTPPGQPPAQNPAPPKTNKLVVCLKAYNNRHYVVSESNKKTVNANRPHCKAWERHTIVDLNGGRLQHGDRVAVRTHWKRYWSAQPNGRLEANRTKLLGWGKFTIRKRSSPRSGPRGRVITYRNKITLQGVHGKYVVAENAGGRDVKANRSKAKEWETFTLVKP